jgi:hypothetical protein
MQANEPRLICGNLEICQAAPFGAPRRLRNRSKSERSGGLKCLREIAVSGSILCELTSVSSGFGSAERRRAPTGAIEIAEFLQNANLAARNL